MANLSNEYREYVRRAWNRSIAPLRGNTFWIDNKPLPTESTSVDKLIETFETATNNGQIGLDGVRGMIDRMVYIADSDWIKQHDVVLRFTTRPFGTVIWRPKQDFLDQDDTFYPPAPAGAPEEAALTDAWSAAGKAILEWAASVGLDELRKLVTKWLNTSEVYWISFPDIRVNDATQLGLWVGRADDTANIFLNGSYVGSADIQFPAGASYYIQPHLRRGRNALTIELRNSGRGRWSIAYRYFFGQRPDQVRGGSQDDQIMDRTRIFHGNIWLE